MIDQLQRFPVRDEPPVTAGTSPFHIRGYYFQVNLRHARALPGGLDAVLARVPDPGTARFLRQKFAWTGWYDVFPAVALLHAASQAIDEPYYRFLERRGFEVATADISRVFRALLSLGRPGNFAQKLPAFASASMDFGSVALGALTPKSASGEHRGIPAYYAPTLAAAMAGFFRGGFEVSGAASPALTHLDVLPDGRSGGFELCKIEYAFAWE